jgi:hypothetical protein
MAFQASRKQSNRGQSDNSTLTNREPEEIGQKELKVTQYRLREIDFNHNSEAEDRNI